MTWEWSHTNEAYENVRNNIRNLDIETLKECVVEIWTYQQCVTNETSLCNLLGEDTPDYDFNRDNYYDEQIADRIRNSERLEELCESHTNSSEESTELSEIVWEFASEMRECDNCGFNSYISPYHTFQVSFSSEEVEKDEL